MDVVFVALLGIGGLLGLAMGLGRLPERIGCAALCVAPFLLFAILSIEPLFSDKRQNSTAALAIPFGTLWIALAACGGALVGTISRWLLKR